MDDDWQDAAFSSRHMHNRRGSSGKSKHSSAFDVRKTFASYSVKCPAWQKALATDGDAQSDQEASLELYRLTESGEGIVGELLLPGVLRSSVILAGSRDSLRRTIADLESGEDASEEDDQEGQGDTSSNTEPESPAKTRFDTFEKNSFRSPKFWFRWSGVPHGASHSTSKENGSFESDLGYLVFSGNDCRKFKGTINCASLKWKNVAITGHKMIARSESDTQVTWGKDEVPI
ncbi:hypothetical protein COCCADRAFT_93319 [Bipolaris zeicola 26-R-13]|uniref:Uncharacterized protein n=1 Tax=Cochliobolus carbonum (strain 26-R-13) TaxID=930089 RepID=W6Y986_COCC2|nr:uncharacterized protein COCCADRAFT_93319 [Bipolaris zeicola 26-R-13]EUC34493.1 hypothetical protein COCCADRAFT_93319 [Bipolaris zeicola 26-R-13]